MSVGILLSGGMDSAALACWRRPSLALTIHYGQASAEGEVRAATQICSDLNVRHEVIRVDCRSLGSGELAGTPAIAIAPVPEWWPYRNQLLVTLAAMRAVALGVTELLVGSVHSDGCHADGRADFYGQLDKLVAMQEGHLRISVPAICMNTAELVRTSGISPATLAWTHSCHTAAFACGRCRGCSKRRSVLVELGYETD